MALIDKTSNAIDNSGILVSTAASEQRKMSEPIVKEKNNPTIYAGSSNANNRDDNRYVNDRIEYNLDQTTINGTRIEQDEQDIQTSSSSNGIGKVEEIIASSSTVTVSEEAGILSSLIPLSTPKRTEFNIADTRIDDDDSSMKKTIASSSRRGKWFSPNSKIKNDAATKKGTKMYDSKQQERTLLILSLPIDSLHTIASFLTPVEWSNFGRSSKGANKISREIIHRVRMHGFRCATEVITAWKLGQHADAKELCALYVSHGVPIYPYSFGHAYHTLIWRLSIEAKQIQEQQTTEGTSSNTLETSSTTRVLERTSHQTDSTIVHQLDSFYNDRDDARMREELSAGLGSGSGILTYLEEKALYNMNRKDHESELDHSSATNWRRMSVNWRAIDSRFQNLRGIQRDPFTPTHNRQLGRRDLQRRNSFISFAHDTAVTPPRHQLTRSNSFSGNLSRSPNVHIKIHRHLLDQHLLGRQGVDDGEGLMSTPPVNLSVDFFHPFFTFYPSASTEIMMHQSSTTAQHPADYSANTFNSFIPMYNQVLPTVATAPANIYDNAATAAVTATVPYSTEDHAEVERVDSVGSEVTDDSVGSVATDDSDSDIEAGAVYPRPNLFEPTRLNDPNEIHAVEAASRPPSMALPTPLINHATTSTQRMSPQAMHLGGQDFLFCNNILSEIDLDVYGASSSGFKSEDDENATERETKNYLKMRFAFYQRRLNDLSSKPGDNSFDECIMDLWDEFFPQTANIQYYDNHTAVPRMSGLHKFLTEPCPKAIGIVQCEIERVRLSSRKKGVNMKGRFFPTYEYRLFIRHRSSDKTSDTDENNDFNNNEKKVRRDTLLMMAKNRGRKHTENKVQASSVTSTKKGSNNYYLYLPSQDDCDLHYKKVNAREDSISTPNGMRSYTGTKINEFSGLLGRLQSNFVGTEFQIFIPRRVNEKTTSLTAKSKSYRHSIDLDCSCSDDDTGYLSGSFFELGSSATSRRRSRFRRLSLKGRNNNSSEKRAVLVNEPSDSVRPISSSLTLRRSRSSGDARLGRNARPNRKVSAAEALESHHNRNQTQSLFFEEEDGAITYTANLLGSRPRIMDVCIPKVNSDGPGIEWKRYLQHCEEHDADRLLNHLKQLQQNGEIDEHGRLVNPADNNIEVLGNDDIEYSPPDDFGLSALQNRPPWWNVELGSFVLNFGGRVSVASVKNFQLCDRNDQDYIMLQFGRIEGRHSFTMDFQYPLTAVQAFAIAISSLQSKISFG